MSAMTSTTIKRALVTVLAGTALLFGTAASCTPVENGNPGVSDQQDGDGDDGDDGDGDDD